MRRLILYQLVLLGLSTQIPAIKRGLRRALRVTTQCVMALRSRPLPDIPGPILVIAPHQDDCTLGCGGLLFQKRLAGTSVHVIYLTDGAASHGGHPWITPAQLAVIRKTEAKAAKGRTYVDSACLSFLNLPDGRLPHLTSHERATALAELTQHIDRIAPSVVLLPFRKDGSTEHEAGFSLVAAGISLSACRPRLLEYPVWANYRPLHLIMPALFSSRIYRFKFKGYGPHKRHALNAYASQFQPTPPWSRPVMPADFTRCFEREEEFFFELKS
jgi:N-acetylglucosamine malate deacetylase 1